MDGTVLADKTRPEALKHPLHLQQGAPVRLRDVGIIGANLGILGKGRGVGNFAGQIIDLNADAESLEGIERLTMKTRNALAQQGNPGCFA